MEKNRLQELFNLYYNKTATKSEADELMRLLHQLTDEQLSELISKNGEQLEFVDYSLSKDRADAVLHSIFGKAPVRQLPVLWKRMAVAATIVFLIGVAVLFAKYNSKRNEADKDIATTEQEVKAPDKSKAVIILSNGERIYLDSVGSGKLTTIDQVNVEKTTDGQILYKGVASATAYNTLNNPRGSRVLSLTLSDGTKVWLNSESSLRYPVAFVGKERKVELTGEGYFEVSKDPLHKFIVETNTVTTEVLGTHFNINSYGDEKSTNITLLEGAVKVSKAGLTGMLKPGQQARVSSEISIENDINTDDVIAWKNGLFSFSDASLETVLKQLARWYDVDVVYEGTIPQRTFEGKMQSDLSLNQILTILKQNNVKYRIEGKKLIIL